ncbi:MAG: DUF424 domain-containing protein [Methanoregulaceae archaeon]|nr:DUF424 domain-containing protein [Methanoregulaceae archaeon]
MHRSPDGNEVVAVCDRELIGTTITHGKLSVRITKEFYGETVASEDEVRKALEQGSNINLMGRRTVDLAVRMGIIDASCCMLIGTVPHAQIVSL